MVKKIFFKNGFASPRRMFKYDLYELYIPKRPIHVVVCPETGLYMCTLLGRTGDVLVKSSSADKLMSVVRDCYRETYASRLYDNDFYNSLTFIFCNV